MQAFKLISSLLFMALNITGCGNHPREVKAAVAPVKVAVFQIAQTTQPEAFTYSGTIEPDNISQIGFAVPGVINNVAVQEGQKVQKGQLLASIDASEYINGLAIANAGLEQAQDLYTRLNGLYQKGSLPAKDFIDIKTKVAQAKANKSINAKRIRDSRLYAPVSGIISTKSVSIGSMAAPGVPAFTIIKTDRVYAQFSVPESEVGSLKYGMSAIVFIPALTDSLTGKITIINPLADAVSKTYSIKVSLNNPRQKLLPGMLTEINIHTGKSINAIVIPAIAIVRDADNIEYVFVANTNKKAIKKRVTTGNLTGSSKVIITEGLAQGDNVVIAGQTRLKDGETISF